MKSKRTVIRKFKVPEKLGISRATLDLWLNPKSRYYDKSLPQQISLSASAKGFFEDELDDWLESRRVKVAIVGKINGGAK